MKFNILITAFPFVNDYKKLRNFFNNHNFNIRVVKTRQSLKEKDLLKLVKNIDGILCGDDEFTEKVIKKASKLKVLSKWGTGIDSIDLKACRKFNVKVYNTPGAFTESVATQALAFILNFNRKILSNHNNIQKGIWNKFEGSTLIKKKVGIIGLGNIGLRIAELLIPFKCQIFGNDIKKINKKKAKKSKIIIKNKRFIYQNSDIIILATDLNYTTQHLINLKLSKLIKKKFGEIKFIDIRQADKILSKISNKKFIIDKNSCSIYFENIISKNNQILNLQDPIYIFKAIKSKNEIRNIKIAHKIDGIALTKYLFWLKKNFNTQKITEISGAQKLFKFRKNNNKFKFLSFPTISGAGPNGAIIHYKASEKTNRVLKKGDIYLVDSGGQYEFGTTDVTRTISLKNTNKRIRKIFTRVLKGHIAVANFKLKDNTSGSIIDSEARKYLRQIGLDYEHGTGHGVGYFLNVHEGPHAISKNNKINFKEGMVVSNEPGYYEKNKFGIRIENLIYVKKEKNKKHFENLTMAPIDKDLIEQDLLNKNEKRWLNSYHKQVFDSLKRAMNRTEILELKKACSAI